MGKWEVTRFFVTLNSVKKSKRRSFDFAALRSQDDTGGGGWCFPRSQKRDLRSKDMNPSPGPRTWGARLIQRYNEDTPEFVQIRLRATLHNA